MTEYIYRKRRQTKADKEFKFTKRQLQWIKALRSGRYCQAQGMLKGESLDNENKVGYCCLGVANKACRLNEKSETALNSTYRKLGLRGHSGKLAGSVYYDLPDGRGQVGFSNLAAANDSKAFNGRGLSFEDIADLIETYPTLVFVNERSNRK